jgi:hypothetical protein
MPVTGCLKCGASLKTLQAWKSHMTSKHGGYDDADLEEVSGASEALGDTRSRMEAFASKLAQGDTGADTKVDGSTREESSKAEPPAPAEKRVKATPKKLKKILGDIPAVILEAAHIELDDSDREALDEAAEFMSDIFGFEFSVPEKKYVVRSRAWAIVWVGVVTGLVYVKHRFASIFKAIGEKSEGKEEPPIVN